MADNKLTYTIPADDVDSELTDFPAVIYIKVPAPSGSIFGTNHHSTITVTDTAATKTGADGWRCAGISPSIPNNDLVYWEFVCAGTSGFQVGVTDPGVDFTANIDMEDSWYWDYYYGYIKNPAGATVYTVATYTSGDVLGFAVNMVTGKGWVAKNNVWQRSGDPAAGTGEVFTGLVNGCFPAVIPYYSGASVTYNATGSSQTYSPPTGFTPLGEWQEPGYDGSEVFDELYGGKDSDTKLLIHADGADASTNITDSSDSGHVVTVEGDAAIKDFNADGNSIVNYSGFFNGTDAYLTIPDHADWPDESSAFTIETWVFPIDLSGSSVQVLYSQRESDISNDGTIDVRVYEASSATPYQIRFDYRENDISHSVYSTSSHQIPENVWTHIACVFDGTDNWEIFINGVSVNSATFDPSSTPVNLTNVVSIGAQSGVSPSIFFTGYLTTVAIHKVAIYTEDFTPPLTIAEMTNDANTVLFLDFTELDQGDTPATVTDTSASAHTVTNVSSNMSGCTFWWDGAIELDGTGDYIDVASHVDFDPVTVDFTIDYWFKLDTVANSASIFTIGETDYNVISIYFNQSTGFIAFVGSTDGVSNDINDPGTTTTVKDRWYHLEVVIDNDTGCKVYLDGVLEITSTDNPSTYVIDTQRVRLGGHYSLNPDYMVAGHMAEFRISKGIARHTTTFIPPTKPYRGSWERIKITDASDNLLYTEVESWDLDNKKATLHVKVPTVSSTADTVLTLDYNDSNADNSDYINVASEPVDDTIYEDFVIEDKSFVERNTDTIRNVIPKAVLTDTDGTVRVTFFHHSQATCEIQGAWIGYLNTDGAGYDFDETPVQITFDGGSATKVLEATSITSDWVEFVVDSTRDMLVSLRYTGGGYIRMAHTITPTGFQAYSKAGVSEEAQLVVTGYSAAQAESNYGIAALHGKNATSRVIDNVWDDNFVFVSHQAQDPSGSAPQILDSTSYGNHGTSYGTMLTEDLIDGVTGKMIDYDGTDDYIEMDAPAGLAFPLTLEVSGKQHSTGDHHAFISLADYSESNQQLGLFIRQDGGGGGESVAALSNYAGTFYTAKGTVILNTVSSYYLTATYNSDTEKYIYTDGTDKQSLLTSCTLPPGIDRMTIGVTGDLSPSSYAEAYIKEVRISNIVRSDDWIALTNESLTDNLFTVSSWTESAAYLNKFTLTISADDIDSTLTDFPVTIPLGSSSGLTSLDTSILFDELTLDGEDETKLLIHADGDDESSDFTDDSNSRHTITTEGDAKIKDFNADGNSIVNYSGFFNGADGYLTIPDHADWPEASTDTFTIEFSVFIESTSDDAGYVYSHATSNTTLTDMWTILVYQGADPVHPNQVRLYWLNSGSDEKLFYTTLLTNNDEWNHIAVTYDGANTLKVWINGVLSDTDTDVVTSLVLASDICIGCRQGAPFAGFFKGYLAGYAIHTVELYTDTFTTPLTIAEMTNDANTVLFLDFTDLTQGSTPATITDTSASAHTVTNVSTNVSGCTFWWDGAIEFDGTGDYLSIPDSTDFPNDSSIPWTIEFWISTDNIQHSYPYCHGTIGTLATDLVLITLFRLSDATYPNKFRFIWRSDTVTEMTLYSTNGIVPGAWNHVEISYTGSSVYIWINGVASGSDASAITTVQNTEDLHIGIDHSDQTSNPFNGYMAELRISKGIARHTTAFTPPTAPYTLERDWKRVKVTDASDNILYTEVENWDVTNKKGTLHVKVPTISPVLDTVLTVDYDSGNDDNTDYIYETESTPSGSDVNVFTGTKSGNTQGGTAGQTYRMHIPSADVTSAEGLISLKFAFATTSDYTIDACYIGNRATSGDVYDFDPDRVQVTFNGGDAGVTVGTSVDVTSDGVAYTVDGSRDLIVSVAFNASQPGNPNRVDMNGIFYYKAGNDASTVDATGYSTYSTNYLTGLVEINCAPMTRNDVWDDNFVFVSHQAQDPSGGADAILDSTSYGKHGTSYGTMLTEDLIDGTVGKALDYDGTDDYTNHGYDAVHDITDTLTLEASFTPNTLLDSSLSVNVGLLDRRHDPTDNEDTYGLMINSDGELQTGTYGGSIESTKASWVADQNFIVGATYNSTGLVGDLFVDGVKETLTNDAYDTMAGSTNNLVIGKNLDTATFFPGAIGEVRISNIVRSDDWISTTHLSLSDTLLTFVRTQEYPGNALSRGYINQTYTIFNFFVRQFLEIAYALAAPIGVGILEQSWSYRFTSQLIQYYGDTPQVRAAITQWLLDCKVAKRTMDILYGTAATSKNFIVQPYGLSIELLQKLEQLYIVSQSTPVNFLGQQYAIRNVEEAKTRINQIYTLYPDPAAATLMPSASVTVNGVSMQIIGLNLEYGHSSYVGSCSVTLANFGDWLLVDYEQAVVITIDAQEYHMVVISKSRREDVKSESLSFEAKSPAAMLDFPYATEISEDFEVSGTESVIVNSLAALEGYTVAWEMTVNDVLTVNELQVAGRSPIECIKEVVNALGGIVQSYPDGSIHAVPRYIIDSDKYDGATPAIIYTSGEDFISLGDEADKRDGFNKYLVTNLTLDDGYTLEAEEISPSHYEVKAYKVPWNTQGVTLTTSELTNVIIGVEGETTEEITEEIEIVEGAGNVAKPCYGLISTDYKTSTDLGAVTILEDGTVSTSTLGNTLVELTYTTKYWLWDTTNIDAEDVQFILEVA